MLSHCVLRILLYKLYIIMLVECIECQINESPRQVTRFNCYTGGSIEKKNKKTTYVSGDEGGEVACECVRVTPLVNLMDCPLFLVVK